MGIAYTKFHKLGPIQMVDKSNYTWELSMESLIPMTTVADSWSIPIKSALKTNSSRDKLVRYYVDKTVACEAGDTRQSNQEIPLESSTINSVTENDLLENERIKSDNCSTKRKSKSKNCRDIKEKAGLKEIPTNSNCRYFRGVIHLPECDVVLMHYLTLYRLKLDVLSEKEFELWCLNKGHKETAKKYRKIRQVYLEMKANHFRESHIINKILSKQYVLIEMSDLNTDKNQQLRSFIIFSRRRKTIRNVIESYCFNVRGKIPFIIESNDDHKTLIKFPETTVSDSIKPVFCDDEMMKNLSGNQFSLTPSRIPATLNETPSRFFNNSNNRFRTDKILRSERGDLLKRENSRYDPSVLNYEPFSNYIRNQKYGSDDGTFGHNVPFIHQGNVYNLVSVFADKQHAYILCKNTIPTANSYNEIDLKSLLLDNYSGSRNINQSNTFSRYKTLKRIMKTEIMETFSQKFYGIALNQVPCGQFHVVQCTIEGRLSERDSILHKILLHHMVCGKVVSKDYNLEVNGRGDLNFTMHLHGNERHVRKCSNELKIEGLARNFKLIHPRCGKLFPSQTPSVCSDVKRN